jgi:outer membrane lipoprotein LolB
MLAMRAVGVAPILLAAAVVAMLAACRTVPPPRAVDLGLTLDWPSRRALLQDLRDYECAGRVAVAASGQGFNAQFTWRQSGAAARLSLRGPLGTGGLEVRVAGDALTMRLADGRHLDGDAARAELERTIGAALPVRALGYWLLGAPSPEVQNLETLAASATGLPAQLAALEQQGWRVQYTAHAELPRQMTLTGGGSRVRVVVERRDWLPVSPAR